MSESAAPCTTVFVYGTLMPGERNAHVAELGGTFQARRATLPRHRLLHLLPEAYPAALPGAAEDAVHGYALTYASADWPLALPFLDKLEGVDEVPPLYIREQVTLTLEDASSLSAWVYLYTLKGRLARPGVQPIPGGDWRGVSDRARTEESDR